MTSWTEYEASLSCLRDLKHASYSPEFGLKLDVRDETNIDKVPSGGEHAVPIPGIFYISDRKQLNSVVNTFGARTRHFYNRKILKKLTGPNKREPRGYRFVCKRNRVPGKIGLHSLRPCKASVMFDLLGSSAEGFEVLKFRTALDEHDHPAELEETASKTASKILQELGGPKQYTDVSMALVATAPPRSDPVDVSGGSLSFSSDVYRFSARNMTAGSAMSVGPSKDQKLPGSGDRYKFDPQIAIRQLHACYDQLLSRGSQRAECYHWLLQEAQLLSQRFDSRFGTSDPRVQIVEAPPLPAVLQDIEGSEASAMT